jgi:hypothetical protein
MPLDIQASIYTGVKIGMAFLPFKHRRDVIAFLGDRGIALAFKHHVAHDIGCRGRSRGCSDKASKSSHDGGDDNGGIHVEGLTVVLI